MAKQEDLEEGILLMLYEESERNSRRLKVREISRKFTPAIGEARIAAGLQHLQKLHLVSGSFDNFTASGFAITRSGILHIEQNYDRNDEGEDTAWRMKADAVQIGQRPSNNSASALSPPSSSPSGQATVPPINIYNNYNPSNEQHLKVAASDDTSSKSATAAGWFGAWGTWVAAVVAILTLAWILHEAKVF